MRRRRHGEGRTSSGDAATEPGSRSRIAVAGRLITEPGAPELPIAPKDQGAETAAAGAAGVEAETRLAESPRRHDEQPYSGENFLSRGRPGDQRRKP